MNLQVQNLRHVLGRTHDAMTGMDICSVRAIALARKLVTLAGQRGPVAAAGEEGEGAQTRHSNPRRRRYSLLLAPPSGLWRRPLNSNWHGNLGSC